MVPVRLFRTDCLVAGLLVLPALALADTYQLILQGVVQMNDGSPPPKTVSIERICSDVQGSAPGPITNKKGEYLWRMEVDPMKTRSCTLRAHLDGYVSSEIDISALNSYSNPKLPPLVLTPSSGDPTVISLPDSAIPAKAHNEWKAAMKAVDASHFSEAEQHLKTAVETVPKFAGGWNALGLVYMMEQKPKDARAAYERAIAADPKMLAPYVLLARTCIFNKDYEAAAKAADAEIKLDTKHVFSEMYMHQAAARYGLKDLDGAEMSAREALKWNQSKRGLRAEYILGRILEAKGDLNGAKEHMRKYIQLDPAAPDVLQIQNHIDNMGKPGAPEPDLELL